MLGTTAEDIAQFLHQEDRLDTVSDYTHLIIQQSSLSIQVTNPLTTLPLHPLTDPGGRVPGREHQVQQRGDVLLRGPAGLLRPGLRLSSQSVPGGFQAAR